MRYWARTTHDFNNETREWEFKKHLPLHSNDLLSLGVHSMDCGKWYSENEIFKEYERYHKHNFEYRSPTKNMIISELEQMEKMGLVKSKKI